MSKSAIVVGAGIVGLATARALAVNGYSVKVIERSPRAIGASVRNFGMVWPIGQPDGSLFERAMRSRAIWKELCDEANIWYDPVGSMHVAYDRMEMEVLEELASIYKHRGYEILDAASTIERSHAAAPDNLMGGLYSPHEMIVDPRVAISTLPSYLEEKFGVEFFWGRPVVGINYPSVLTSEGIFRADEVFVCSGADFETLYPAIYASLPITKCKLQMMRLAVQPGNWRIGPALCGGLSLLHYQSFKAASSLNALQKSISDSYPEHLKWGIHVMASQNREGELTVGDSHEYGQDLDPFDRHEINELILSYFASFARVKDMTVSETWNGIYPKLTNGDTHIMLQPQDGVSIINGLGGAGMTLSFGLCEELIRGV